MTEFGATFWKEIGLGDDTVDLGLGAPGKRFLVESTKLMQKATLRRLVRMKLGLKLSRSRGGDGSSLMSLLRPAAGGLFWFRLGFQALHSVLAAMARDWPMS